MGRAVITGTLQRYTIQYSETSNQIVLSLNKDGEQTGSVNSMVRVQLTNADRQGSRLPELLSPVSLGSLVYAYGKHGSVSNKVSQGKIFQQSLYHRNGESQEENSNYLGNRQPPSLSQHFKHLYSGSEESMESEEDWTASKSKLSDAPWIPLLPYYIGYYGMPIKKAQNIQIVEKVYTIIKKISAELSSPQSIPKEHTLAKYVLLTSLLRTMDEQELKQVVERIFAQDTETRDYYAWVVLRDCLAETGTGPALLIIKDLIESKKLYGNEASTVIVTIEKAIRQPSGEYMKTCYEMMKKQLSVQEEDQFMLNETMLFSFTHLVHKVYVNTNFSHREYPTHTFGKFYTKEGEAFVKEEVVPYLSKQLHEAIIKGESRKILAYITALGNTGHGDIVYVFEPYLEGKIQVSQFQRFMMVASLRYVAEVHPRLVQQVLYRIYQNVGERMETRILAVYLLVKSTNPSSEMLQRIAAYTNWEPNHAVCSAVISVIESASKLEGLEFAELKSSAESAKTLLTRRNFGIQDSMAILVNYASLNWGSYYAHDIKSVVSEESGLPTSFLYSFESNSNGLNYRFFSLDSFVSDIRSVFHIFLHQTEWYQQQKVKQESSQQSEKSSWSSHKIASMLNLKTEELEQLEGFVKLHLVKFEKYFIFNNHTIENLPQWVDKLEGELKNGKQMNYTKLMNNYEYALSLPTELGLPFLCTHDLPVYLHIGGNFKGTAEPKLSSGNKLVIPDNIEFGGMFKAVLSFKKRIQIGLVTPFNHHQYLAGYDQNMQLYLPLKTMININMKQKNVELKVESLDYQKEIKILHKSSWPYVSKHNILKLEAVASGPYTQVIRKEIQHQLDQTFGDESVGVPFRVRYESDGRYSSIESLMRGKIFDSTVHYEKTDVEYLYGKSHNKEVKVGLKYVVQQPEGETTEYSRKGVWERMVNLPEEDEQRVNELSKQASVGIPGAYVQVYDSKVEFSGQQNVQFIASLAYGRSYLRSKARILGYVKKQSQISASKPFEAALSVNYNMSRLSSLDLKHVMNSNITSFIDIDAAFGEKLPSKNEAQISVVLKRSNSRKEYLMEQSYYSTCQHEMKQGNKHLLACANITQLAGLLDHVKVNFTYSSMDSHYLKSFVNYFNRYSPYYKFKVDNNRDPNHKEGVIIGNIRFQPDLKRVSVSAACKTIYASIKNIYIDEWTRPLVVAHPVFDVIDRVEGKLYGFQTYRPMCSMDKSQAYSFDGAEYPLKLSNYWTVILQYVPHRSWEQSKSSVEEQLKHELDNYVVLARQSSENPDSRELKIVVSTPRTDGRVVEVELKPVSSGSYPQVFVDGQEVSVVSEDKAYETHQGQIGVVGLPAGEVYVRVSDSFYIIYDGRRFKITPLSFKLRNAIRGLCGLFDGRKNDDFVTPNNCIVREPREFIASYTVMQNGEQNITSLKSSVQNGHCIYKKVPLYGDYISEAVHRNQTHSCSKYQTRYVVENDQICFTIRPQSACKIGCRQHGNISKSVDVHCVVNTNIASLWKSQIDKGASPDFSKKPVTKVVNIELPESCISM
ncbi:hypothetical protein WA026_008969 [Henosepilachna vigintioctopunctata]|uniref:Vitellogenin n=1 Tax=Henosepilachna vigintioctopunctata TaxID=420089 RepID=A0AAW1V4I4_9CUCU